MADESSTQVDPYLNSPKEFHLEMPLYHELDLEIGVVADKIYKMLCYPGTIDAYCIWCCKESVFDANEYLSRITYEIWRHEHRFTRYSYRCSRDSNHKYFSFYLKGESSFLKIGQFPSVADFQIPQAEKYRKILGENKYKELVRGIGLSAHGVGIGSFVYLRRIFESLIEDAHAVAKTAEDFPKEKYRNSRMDEKIQLLKGHLPFFLVENKNIYAVLSKGIHELTEEECLKYFPAVKIGIEQILDEKMEQIEKAEKAAKARAAIHELTQKIT